MKQFKINVFITEGSRHNSESAELLVQNAESIFRSNGFSVSFPIVSTAYIQKVLDNGVSIYDFNIDKEDKTADIVNEDPHIISVESHRELNLFPHNDTINVVFVKSLHDTVIDSWPNSVTFKDTNTIFISEGCYYSSLAHSLMNHFGVSDQYHDPRCLSYGCECLRKDTQMSEDEKLILSQELPDSIISA